MATIVSATQSDSPHMLITAEEIKYAPWEASEDGSKIRLCVEDKDKEEHRLLKTAIENHGLHGALSKDDNDGLLYLEVDISRADTKLAIQQIKDAPDDFTGGVVNFGFGPDPTMQTLDVEKARLAQQRLQDVLEHNHNAGVLEEGISADDAETLVEWIVQRARNDLFETKTPHLPSAIRGACGYGQSIVGHQAELLDIQTHYHQVANLSDSSLHRHAFNVLEIPVKEEDGHTQNQAFLVDTTFRQFFSSTHMGIHSENGPKVISSWGGSMTQTPEGQETATAILQDGYVKLDQDTARLYVESQTYKTNPESEQYEATTWNTDDPLAALKLSNVENDYDLEEIVGYNADIRTPEMVYNDAALSEVLHASPKNASDNSALTSFSLDENADDTLADDNTSSFDI